MALITRYFIVNDTETKDYKSNLTPDNDVLPLAQLQSVVVGTLNDGRKVIHAILPRYLIKEMQELAELQDPLTIEGVQALDIVSKWGGMDRESLLERYPELAGQYQSGVDEEGQPVMIDRLMAHKWAGEEE